MSVHPHTACIPKDVFPAMELHADDSVFHTTLKEDGTITPKLRTVDPEEHPFNVKEPPFEADNDNFTNMKGCVICRGTYVSSVDTHSRPGDHENSTKYRNLATNLGCAGSTGNGPPNHHLGNSNEGTPET